jgi:hypothetical protein
MIELIRHHVIPAAYSLLPPRMQTVEATALLYAIGLQESRFTHRQQVGGPARGFWQFERGGGVTGVLTHRASAQHATAVFSGLQYSLPGDVLARIDAVYALIAHNDVAACALARLLLWTDGKSLPSEVLGPTAGWLAYTRNWRPGKPHRDTWDEFWRQGWLLARQGF